jgi:hypothetical protein
VSKISDITEYNLDKDKNVLGKEWLSTYGGYFSDKENIKLFIDAVKPFLPNKKLDVLYVASASGLLGEELLKDLGKGHLTLVDISQRHLDENKNPKTTKLCLDLLKMDLGKQFDLIMMRSSLDYFSSKAMQIKVLKVIKKHLNEDGLFINQPAYIPNITERDIISEIYIQNKKMGNRFFQSTDLREIYAEAGFNELKKIGNGKVMVLTEKDHIERYNLGHKDIGAIKNKLKNVKNVAKITNEGYSIRFEFPIFLAKNNS